VRVTFCGTRGSTPAPGLDYIRFGGHTSCVAVSHDDEGSVSPPVLLLDAGTGLRRLTGSGLLGNAPFRGTLLLTHLHWDHVQGLPFFRSGDRDDAQVRMLLPDQGDGADAEMVLARMMSPPFFPIEPSALRGDWTFGFLPDRKFTAEGFSVQSVDVPHKGGHTVGLRISDGHSSIAYIPDHCPTALGPGPDGIGAYHQSVLELADGVDLLIHDAHLRAEEVEEEGSFGHAAAEYAVGLGTTAGARRIALFHHRPERTDSEVERTVCRFAGSPVPVVAAAETLTIRLS
jgi:phosphoribosyl 1,2-cyclic phosphodiesterase